MAQLLLTRRFKRVGDHLDMLRARFDYQTVRAGQFKQQLSDGNWYCLVGIGFRRPDSGCLRRARH